jgi:hypothetical protein
VGAGEAPRLGHKYPRIGWPQFSRAATKAPVLHTDGRRQAEHSPWPCPTENRRGARMVEAIAIRHVARVFDREILCLSQETAL